MLKSLLLIFALSFPAQSSAGNFQVCIKDFFKFGVETNHDVARKILRTGVVNLTNFQINCYRSDSTLPPMTKQNLRNATQTSIDLLAIAEETLTMPEKKLP